MYRVAKKISQQSVKIKNKIPVYFSLLQAYIIARATAV
jgi:hypothetical protein